MANANINNTANNNGKAKVTKIQQIVEKANSGAYPVMGIVSLVGGNRPANDEYNRLSLHADKTYVTLLTPKAGLPDLDTRYTLENDGKEGYIPDMVKAQGPVVPWMTESGNTELFMVSDDAPEVIKGGEGVLPPPTSYTEVVPAPEAADEPAQDSAQAAPEAQVAETANVASGGEYGLIGALFVQKGGVANLVVNGHTTKVTSIPEGTPYVPRTFKVIVFFNKYEEDETKVNHERFTSVDPNRIVSVPKEQLSAHPDGLIFVGPLTATEDGQARGNKAWVKCSSDALSGTFNLNTDKGKGTIAHSYVANTKVGDSFKITSAKAEKDARGTKLSEVKGGNETQKQAVLAAKTAEAAQAA